MKRRPKVKNKLLTNEKKVIRQTHVVFVWKNWNLKIVIWPEHAVATSSTAHACSNGL